MYTAIVRNDIPTTCKIDGIRFSEKKACYINKIVLLKCATKGLHWYSLKNSSLLFHRDWLKNIIELRDCVFIQTQDGKWIIINPNNLKEIITSRTINRHMVISSLNLYEIENSIDRNSFDTYSLSDEYTTCNCCNENLHNIFISRQNNICEDCYITHKISCSLCGNYYFNKNNTKYTIDNRKVYACEQCYSEFISCKNCNILTYQENILIFGEKYCLKCAREIQKNHIMCDYCKTFFKQDVNYIQKDIHGKWICKLCSFAKKTKNINGGILEYNYKPKPIFFGDDILNNLWFGVELETIAPQHYRNGKHDDAIAKWIQMYANDTDEFCYCKFDRSIGRDGTNGFEIVTHPFSWEWLLDQGIRKFETLFDIKKFGCNSFKNNTCGMHVHMSKEAFENDHLYKFLKMIYDYKQFSILISERTDQNKINSYSNFEIDNKLLKEISEIKRNITKNRHKAVNLSCQDTIEIRIFRSTLKFERFMKNIEYCYSLYNFTKNTTDVSLKSYLMYLRINSDKYPNLYSFLKKKEQI